MKVYELIKVLKTYPQEMDVYARNQGNGTFGKSIGVRTSLKVAKEDSLVLEGLYACDGDKVENQSYDEWALDQPQNKIGI